MTNMFLHYIHIPFSLSHKRLGVKGNKKRGEAKKKEMMTKIGRMVQQKKKHVKCMSKPLG